MATELSHKNASSRGYQHSVYSLINTSNSHMSFRTKQYKSNTYTTAVFAFLN